MELSGKGYRSVWSHLMQTAFKVDFKEIDGIKTRYIQAGNSNAPKLILLHGMNGSFECFCANLPAYAEHFNVFAFDMFGSGFTDRPDMEVYEIEHYVNHVIGFMDALSIERASFVGVSMGSWVTAKLIQARPERVNKFIMCAAAGMRRDESQNFDDLEKMITTRAAAADSPTWDKIANVFNGIIHDPKNVLPDFVTVRQAVFSRPNAKAAITRILNISKAEVFKRNHLTEDDWSKIETPTLVILAGCDSERIKDNSRLIADLMPNGSLVEIEEASHWPQFEDAERFNKLTLDFFLS